MTSCSDSLDAALAGIGSNCAAPYQDMLASESALAAP